MKRTILFGAFMMFFALSANEVCAQQSVVDAINEYGKFDKWCRREIKESAVIGGNTK